MRAALTLIFCFIGVIVLLQVASQRGKDFRDIKKDIERVERSIAKEIEQINILRADWDILNTPKSLRSLVQKTHLKLYPVEGAQIISSVNAIPLHSRYIPVGLPPRRLPNTPELKGSEFKDIESRDLGIASDVNEDVETQTTLSNLLRLELSDTDILPQNIEEKSETFRQALTKQPFEFETTQVLKGDEQ